MNLFFKKYRSITSSLLLGGYLTLCAINIFHYHVIDLRSGDYDSFTLQDNDPEHSKNHPHDISQCTILHFFSSVHSVFVPDSVPILNNVEEKSLIVKETISGWNLVHYKLNPLRAPPQFS
jgi:hypothetical protein